jgi:hypothetical protein
MVHPIFINMSKKKVKERLKRRGVELYNRYFYNNDHTINSIIELIDHGQPIDDSICNTVFEVSENSLNQIYELISYYPNLLLQHNLITDAVLTDIYVKYGETIGLMNQYKTTNNKSIRSRLHNGAHKRVKDSGIEFDITSEDIILVEFCPLLGVELEYANSKATDFSPSLGRIDPTKGYIKDNIQVVSFLANRMKNSATPEMLVRFANNILDLYGYVNNPRQN